MKKKNVKSSISSQHHSNDQPNYYTPHRMKESSSCTKPSVHDQANHHHHKIEIKAVKGKQKQKKLSNQRHKQKQKCAQNTKKSHLMTSKSSKKMLKIQFPNKQKKQTVQASESKKQCFLPSFRQYCIVEGKFIPLANSNDKRFLNSVMFAETACTSTQIQPDQLQKNSISTETLKVQFKNYSVLVRAAMEDRGVQFSGRTITENSEHSQDAQSEKQESLKEILFKLEFWHLSQQNGFNNLNLEQKRHFRKVFSSAIEKLRSPRIQPPNNRNPSDKPQIQILKLCKSEENSSLIIQKFAKQEELIYRREAEQHNEILKNLQPSEIDTSTRGVITVFTDLFYFVEVNYSEDFVKSLNKMYGWSYKDKYKFISKVYRQNFSSSENNCLNKILIQINKRQNQFRILSYDIFDHFVEEVFSKNQANELSEGLHCHCKCIFNCINQLLQPYQPYYYTKGDSFPWATKIFKSITFYSIDLQTIQAVFEQIKEKIFSFSEEYLCGLLINEHEPFQDDPISQHRILKEKKLMSDELESYDYLPQIEISGTCIIFELSSIIMAQVLKEAGHQIYDIL